MAPKILQITTPVDGYYERTKKKQPAPEWLANLQRIADLYEKDYYMFPFL